MAATTLVACGPAVPSAVPASVPAPALAGEPDAELAHLRARVAELEERLARRPAEPAPSPQSSDATCAELAVRVADLELELARAEAARMAREREWLTYTGVLAGLDLDALPAGLRFRAQVPEEDAGEAAAQDEELDPLERARRERDAAVFRKLRALLVVEEVRGLDLLESGRVHDGWTGPVVFRLLDDRGRLSGGLTAERLRLEGSRAGRTLTIVLEEGYETHRGERVPFDAVGDAPGDSGGVRRILLPSVDPLPWVESLPELFGDTGLAAERDDGRWNPELVRQTLNRLLRVSHAGRSYRLESVAGVVDGVLQEVHLAVLDGDGRLERRIFADRLEIRAGDEGVLLHLEDGVHVRGDRKAPFLDGRLRLYLPGARPEEWRAAELPGVGRGDAPPTAPTDEASAADGEADA